MSDRLMAVGAERACGFAELPVEVDGGVEGEDAGGDACDQAGGCAGEVLFEPQLVFEALHDRFDPLSDRPDRRVGPVGLVGAAGAQQAGAERGDCSKSAPAKPLSAITSCPSIG